MSDDVLINQFSRERCERAFAALVERHLHLVFSTALRQVGDRQLAEEIAQNVFLALANKAGRLGTHRTVSGWLYQATLKEARLAIRSKIRRQRREEIAISAGTLHALDEDRLDGIIPLLDEALADLRDKDRLAVILRFLEGRPWKEVGALTGVSEDAAQKRVGRAMETLGRFFSRHGFKVSVTTLATGMTGQASAVAPAALAGVVTQAAIAKTATSTGIGILVAHFMNLTKTQTMIATVLVCAAPIAYEVNAVRKDAAANSSQLPELSIAQANLNTSEDRLRWMERQLAAMDRTFADLNGPGPVQEKPSTAVASIPRPVKPVGWRDDLPYVEVPKPLLKEVGIPSLDPEGRLQEEIIDALAMTPDESSEVQSIVQREQRSWNGLEASSARYDPAFRPHIGADGANEMISYRFPALPVQAAEAREKLVNSLQAVLGVERTELLVHHGQSIAHLTSGGGRPERVVTLVRTGNPESPVQVVQTRRPEGNDRFSSSYSISGNIENLEIGLSPLPPFMRPIAVRWVYNDRAR